jgi:hypothetical protein
MAFCMFQLEIYFVLALSLLLSSTINLKYSSRGSSQKPIKTATTTPKLSSNIKESYLSQKLN